PHRSYRGLRLRSAHQWGEYRREIGHRYHRYARDLRYRLERSTVRGRGGGNRSGIYHDRRGARLELGRQYERRRGSAESVAVGGFMAAVVVTTYYKNVVGSRKQLLMNVTLGNGDTLNTGLTVVNQVNPQPATNTPTAITASGGILTFTSGGA